MAIAGLYKTFNHWHQQGTLFIYSDPHFGDAELAAGVSNRPTDEEQLAMINSKVGKNDTIIILGDCGNPSFISRIRARYKILVMGNHDAGRTNYERTICRYRFDADNYTKEEVEQLVFLQHPGWKLSTGEGYDISHAPFHYWEVFADNRLFDEVYEGPVMIGEKLILSHEPVDIPWAFNIHGHVHDLRHKNDDHHFNVCAEVINYTPVNMNQWMKQGHLSHIETIHRATIDIAIERSIKREEKKRNRYKRPYRKL